MFLRFGFLGGGSNGAGSGSYVIFVKKDGQDAVFSSVAARDKYFTDNPDELRRIGNNPVAIGSPDAITAAYIYNADSKKWQPVVENFRGPEGKKGDPGQHGAGVDPSVLAQGDIPRWDATQSKFVGSGLKSENQGEISIAPDSIFFGNHSMSTSVENVVFRNLSSHRVYAPLWQEVAPGQDVGYVRAYSATIDKVVRIPDGNVDVTNPANEGIVIDRNEVFLGGTFTLSQDATNLMLEIYDHASKKLMWRQRFGDQVAGEKSITFLVPFDVKRGYTYDIKLLSEDGSDVVAKSNKNTGFSWTVNRAEFTDVPVATQPWVTEQIGKTPAGGKVSDAITQVSLNGDRLTFTHGDGAKHVIVLPAGGSAPQGLANQISTIESTLTTQGQDLEALKNQYGQLDHKIDGMSGAYSYDGSLLPDYPDDPKHSYFVHLHSTAARSIEIDLPNPSSGSLIDGTMFVLGNANTQATVTIRPSVGSTIEGKNSITVSPTHYVMLVKTGTNWAKIIDSSLTTSQVPLNVTPDMIFNAIDRGTFNGSGSLKTLDPGWWVIPGDNKGASGRPPGSQGDLIFYNVDAGKPDRGNAKYGVNMAFGKDANNDDQAWTQYRLTTGWTAWIPLYQKDGSPVDLSQIQQDIADIKNNVATNTGAISTLQTDLGNIFAPDKAAFDAGVNALLKPYNDRINAAESQIKSLPADIERTLQAKGWGPLGSGGSSGDRPPRVLPEINVKLGDPSAVPADFTDAVKSTTGEATVLRANDQRQRLYVFVIDDNDEAQKVTGISVNGGMASSWQSRDVTINGKKYRCFYSAGDYTETKLKIKVNFE